MFEKDNCAKGEAKFHLTWKYQNLIDIQYAEHAAVFRVSVFVWTVAAQFSELYLLLVYKCFRKHFKKILT